MMLKMTLAMVMTMAKETMTTIKMLAIRVSLLYVYIQRTGTIHSSEPRKQ